MDLWVLVYQNLIHDDPAASQRQDRLCKWCGAKGRAARTQKLGDRSPESPDQRPSPSRPHITRLSFKNHNRRFLRRKKAETRRVWLGRNSVRRASHDRRESGGAPAVKRSELLFSSRGDACSTEAGKSAGPSHFLEAALSVIRRFRPLVCYRLLNVDLGPWT